MSRCTVCKLPLEKLAAVDEALRGRVPLEQIASTSGISRSALSRHSQHAAVKPAASPVPISIADNNKKPALQPVVAAPVASSTQERGVMELSGEQTKSQLLEKIEYLWNESLDGLEASKAPVTINRPDGTAMEIPGDLRARAGFIREARQVLELHGEATGHLARGQQTALVHQVMIVIPMAPQLPAEEADDDGCVTLDISSVRY